MSKLEKKVVKVAVTGASGHIGYGIVFRILNGDVFGKETKIDLQLIDINVEKVQKEDEFSAKISKRGIILPEFLPKVIHNFTKDRCYKVQS